MSQLLVLLPFLVGYGMVAAIYFVLFSVGPCLQSKEEVTAHPAKREPEPKPRPHDLPHAA